MFEERIELERTAIENRTGKSPEFLYDQKEKRVRDAIELKEPAESR